MPLLGHGLRVSRLETRIKEFAERARVRDQTSNPHRNEAKDKLLGRQVLYIKTNVLHFTCISLQRST